MEKTVNLNQPGVMELESKDLKRINGGLGPLAVILAVGGVVGLALGWKKLCDEVNELGQEIGAALAEE